MNQNGLRYLPGLDGLRAVAVIAVILYHANKTWLGGGFLGVEVFFVISGYLITTLLINESDTTGMISFRSYGRVGICVASIANGGAIGPRSSEIDRFALR